MSEAMYQLKNDRYPTLEPGDVVAVNGPHDTFGIIISKKENGFYLIRGTGHKNKYDMDRKSLPQF